MIDQPHLCVIDGSGFIFRAFHALPSLSRPDGTPVNALYGFCQMLVRLRKSLSARHWVVVFDTNRQTFRQALYPAYKAHRPPPPPELVPQFALIRDACDAYQVPRIEKEGFEADDLMATYAYHAHNQGWAVTLVTSDKDMMQVVNRDAITLYDPMKRQRMGYDEVITKFGVPPHQVVDVLALMGDRSDNIPGVPGIGPKIAADLIQTYSSLDTLYAEIHTVPAEGRRQKLALYRDQAFLSRELVTLKTDVPMTMHLDDFAVRPIDPCQWNTFLKHQGFHSLVIKEQPPVLPQEESLCETQSHAAPLWIHHLTALHDLASQARLSGILSMVWAPEPRDASSCGVLELATSATQSYRISIAHPQTSWTDEGLTMEHVISCLEPLWLDPHVQKITYNLKSFAHVWGAMWTTWSSCHDVMILAYITYGREQSEGISGLKTLLQAHHLNPSDDGVGYASLMIDATQGLLAGVQNTSLEDLYQDIEIPLIQALRHMETEGVYLNRQTLHDLGQTFSDQMVQAEQRIHQAAGQRFNVASPKQLGIILFEHLQLPQPVKTKTGQYSTDSEVLESLAAQGYTIAQHILDWRQWSKLHSTYVEGLSKHISPQTHRVHTTYHMTATSTGRLSSSHPNLQNLPNRSTEGRAIRSAFQAQNQGSTLVWLDYSQIELRLLAHIADVQAFKAMFHTGQDIHTLTASSLLQIPMDHVTSDQRRRAKIINFGVIYGMSAFGLARQLGVSRGQAISFIQNYFQRYPEILTFMESTKSLAREQGYVETLFGRRCAIQGLHDRHQGRKNMAERQAINAPIQGSQADIIKKAMVQMDMWLTTQHLKSRMILQVHDELVFECPETESAQVAAHAQHIMTHAIDLSVPLVVNQHINTAWI